MSPTGINWNPKRTHDEVDKILCAPNALHELETREIDGQVQRVYKNLWPSLRIFWLSVSKQHSDKTCVVYENQRLTFGEVAERAARAASIFRNLFGVKKGDRIAICSRNYPEYLVLFWACHLIGAVSVLVNAWLPLDPLKHCLSQTTCTLIFVDSERATLLSPAVAEIKSKARTKAFLVLEAHEGKGSWPAMENWTTRFEGYNGNPQQVLAEDPRIVPEDDATILFTSGTGGTPKGCLSTQRAFLSNLFNSLASMGRAMLRRGESLVFGAPPGPQAALFLPTPLFHSAGTSLLMIGALTGGKLVLMRQWNVENAVRLIKQEGIVFIGGVQSTISDMANSEAKGAPLRTILYGGASVSPSQAKRALSAFPTASLSHAYGLTETNATTVSFSGEDYLARLDSWSDTSPISYNGSLSFFDSVHHSGRPMPVDDVLIMSADATECPTGIVGEVWLRGPNIMKGYWGDPVATSKVKFYDSIRKGQSLKLKKVLTKDGWLKTGDMAYMDKEGFLYIKDRLKDIIIRGGENIDSISVENALYTDDGVQEAAAVGVADARLGELVTALVTVKPEHKKRVNVAGLMDVARKNLPKFAVPVMILIREQDFTHTPSGKIIKGELRKIAAEEWAKRQNSQTDRGKL
ncbi:uncharacterized protein C8R40DRAFT_1167375 [Lentinula edodes]|uniref:uncharacterized protein n=1 Tax=Lentinula edodes TaxID=5353 RepID=UPI001E8EA266|nr:uncharacterized protein C8R40DRAFT_1167375 [Lentinula edodes]KAH7878655.1 hypothetical protein C8R40DRAFT_1167375 [Lentinula edodes]KAJ3921211.1 hypothetical protein F5877DRAFT_76437 [Lentinula edodes]